MVNTDLARDEVQLLARYLVAFRGGDPDAVIIPSFTVQAAIRATRSDLRYRPTPAWFNAVPAADAMLAADPLIFGRIAADARFDPVEWHRSRGTPA